MDLDELIKKQKVLLSKARKILASFPQPGLYDGEPKEDFPKFIRFVKDLFRKDQGERGIFKRETQKEFQKKEKEFQHPLSLCGCTVKDPIDYVYYRFGLMKKGKEYDNYIFLKYTTNTTKKFIQDLETEGSEQREKIKKGIESGILKRQEKRKKLLEREIVLNSNKNESESKIESEIDNRPLIGSIFDQNRLDNSLLSKKEGDKEKEEENEKKKEIEEKEEEKENKEKGKEIKIRKEKEKEKDHETPKEKGKIEQKKKQKYEQKKLMQKQYTKQVDQRILKIISTRKKQLSEKEKTLDQIKENLKKDKDYQNWKIVNNKFKTYFDRWIYVDHTIGEESKTIGDDFEKQSETLAIPIIINRLGLEQGQYKVFSNVYWNNVDGEIDFVITDQKEEKVIALIECKSRVFDIAAGYRQSGPCRISKGKKGIKIKKKILNVPKNVPCYIVTLIQENRYILGLESKLKEKLTKIIFNFEKKWDNDQIYNLLKIFCKGKISPLQWFDLYANDNLIVL
ncbi:protein restricted tev movement 2 [Anaeramoeba flamelloides]|uniref:Protein restricted tev movement 2 n=1 Tax=Anaeramoeba flamelloides TaxID=1746091 RepID=A0ABQ8Y6A8_9EUKA|nr:protein restricted tev movement 2 [Anaeramoeba flamelloides]